MQIWHFWTDLDFRSSDLKSATLPSPSQNANLVFLDRTVLQEFRFEKYHFPPPPPENANLTFWTNLDFRSSDVKGATTSPPSRRPVHRQLASRFKRGHATLAESCVSQHRLRGGDSINLLRILYLL